MTTHRRTLYGAIAQTAQLLGCPLPLLPNSTLNQKFNVQADATLSANEIPRVVGFCMGNGAHTATSVGALTRIITLDHKAISSGLFNTMPFALREVGNDIPVGERKRYILRALVTINSVNYIAYWGRVIDTSNASIRAEIRTVTNNQTTSVNFIPSLEDLSPTPSLPTPDQANPGNGQYAVASAQVVVRLDSFDVAEILAAAAIMFGDESLAFMSEIALLTGVLRQTSSPDGQGGSISVQESVATQIFSFIEVMQPLHSQRDGVTLTYDIGANEPLTNFAP